MEALSRYESLVDDFEAFVESCQRPLPTTVRVSTIKGDVDRTVRAFEDEGIEVERRDWHPGVLEVDTSKPGNTWPYVHGWVHGQEEVSAIPAAVLAPAPGDVVFDPCAAPGSKTTQLAAEIEDRGLVVANDDNLGRLSALRGNCDRLGITCAAVTNRDARHVSLDDFGGVDAFDGAVVDVPCTCEGTIRKNPDALESAGRQSSRQMAKLQTAILRRAIDLTRAGGTVVYSTCTFAPEENEGVVDAVLGDGDVELVPFEIGLEHDDGITDWLDESYDDSLRHAKRFYPHQNDTGGFFTAKLEVRG